MTRKKSPSFPLTVSSLVLSLLPASGAVISLAGGSEGGAVLQSQDRFVVDLGFLVPALPVTTNLALFEAGGDGDGTAIALTGNSIQIYLDNQSGGTIDTNFGVNISSFAGQVVTIRLQGDYTGATGSADSAQLDITNGTASLTSGLVALASNHTQAGGGDGYGTGGRGGGSWPGLSEDPTMAQFNVLAYDISDNGINVVGSEELVGVLNTGASDSDTALTSGIPAPSSWGIIPEPSSGLLALLGAGLLASRQRR